MPASSVAAVATKSFGAAIAQLFRVTLGSSGEPGEAGEAENEHPDDDDPDGQLLEEVVLALRSPPGTGVDRWCARRVRAVIADPRPE